MSDESYNDKIEDFDEIYNDLVRDAKDGSIELYSDFSYEGLRVLYSRLKKVMIRRGFDPILRTTY